MLGRWFVRRSKYNKLLFTKLGDEQIICDQQKQIADLKTDISALTRELQGVRKQLRKEAG